MPYSHPSNPLPSAALREFTKIAKADWQSGVALAELLDRVNRVAVLLVADDDTKPSTGRVKLTFSERSFRHYQTLGCIDAPEKRGRLASYGFRHFLQALLIRKLLWEKMSAEQITAMLGSSSTDALERMLLGGVEMEAQVGGGASEGEKLSPMESFEEIWNRVRVAPGLELHVRPKLLDVSPEGQRRLMARLKEVLKRQGS